MSNFSKNLDNISSEKRLYLIEALPSHLTDAGLIERFQRVLTDFEFMELKVSLLGPQSLINDYELSDDTALRLIQNALRLEAHVLIKHPNLLFQQIYNRLQWERNIVVLNLTTQSQRIAKLATEPWLHLLTPLRESRALIRTFSGHSSGVNGCAFFPDGKSIISVSRDMTAKIWNVNTGQEIASFPELNGTNEELSSCAVSPDGSWLITNLRFGHFKDEALRIWDANTYKLLFSIGANDEVTDCAVSPNGKMIASASVNGTVKLSDASSGKEILLLDGHEGTVWGCTFSPDGTLLVSASADKTLKIWDVATGKVRRTLQGHNDQVRFVRVSLSQKS